MTDEAWRCANCGCVAVNASDLANVLVALDAEVRTTQRTLPAGDLFSAAENGTTLLNPNELIREVFLPALPAGTRQTYLKFRIRNSIDFPIVSVAYRARIDGGQVHEARLVLGAVAPIPLRAREVEQFLEGKTASPELARDAAALSVKDVQPLARNRAKVEILKALVAKAVLGE
jgi:CO/xanthine dehydrogenase FAD-binding subunit